MRPLTASAPGWRRHARIFGANIVVLGFLLLLVEGLASFSLLIHDLNATHGLPGRRHTNYDPDLGWVNMPNVHIRNLYGPGIDVTTNGQGFRNSRDFAIRVPNGRYRLICAGDSFTFGVGVGNDHTWCDVLTTLDSRFETVNMGLPGYGVDQTYLLYRREGSKLEHQVLLFSLITWDISRMQSATFEGFGKPVLDLEHGTLVVKNVPVPKRAYNLSWFTQRARLFGSLRMMDLADKVLRRIARRARSSSEPSETGDEKTREILHVLLADLKRLTQERSSQLVLVYLPTLSDFELNGPQGWSRFIAEESRALDVSFIDVLAEFRSLPGEDVVKMFIPWRPDYPGASHLNESGNAFVAKVIYKALESREAISRVPPRRRAE